MTAATMVAKMVDVPTTSTSAAVPGAQLRPGGPAVCEGSVWHRRSRPSVHEFTYDVAYVWFDPDHPDELCRAHPLWSARRPAPARFRRRDYGATPSRSLAEAARDDLAAVLGRRPAGPVRMLTQIRCWGWLFNPITVYVVWDEPGDAAGPADPVAAVLEVTNTPWKERHRYAIALRREGDALVATTDKRLHVSPFLDEHHRYDVRVRADGASLELAIDVVPRAGDEPVVETRLAVVRRSPDRAVLSAALRRPVAPTHRVSVGIHWQALRLWLRRVPFVPHPTKREARS